LSSNSLTLALVVAFSVGLLVFIVGTLLVRYADVLSSRIPQKTSSYQDTVVPADTNALAILGLNEPPAAAPALAPTPTLIPASTELRTIDIPQIVEIDERPWTYEVVGSSVEVELEEKLDMIERLIVLNSAWSQSVLELARAQEDDPRIISLLAAIPGNTA
ncbi:MAG: hypothetical protein ACYDA1_10585, partial [Vulcanimicrobiaceae bacterium]